VILEKAAVNTLSRGDITRTITPGEAFATSRHALLKHMGRTDKDVFVSWHRRRCPTEILVSVERNGRRVVEFAITEEQLAAITGLL
jgi:hypothetical protein